MFPDTHRQALAHLDRVGKHYDRKRYLAFGPLKFHKWNPKHITFKLRKPVIRYADCIWCGRRYGKFARHQTIVQNGSSRPQIVGGYKGTCGQCERPPSVSRITKAAYEWMKSNVSCVDCGRWYSEGAMEFDHLPQYNKRDEMSDIRGTNDLERFVDELEKCEVVCANCHRIRTSARRSDE